MHVAIIGARGIGKHHAKWFHLAGCHVVAFSGTSPETCRQTEEMLRGLFGFQGRSYTDYREMLASETLDAVSVCSPPHAHDKQVRAALDAGLHVYCEKPFVWPPDDALAFPMPAPDAGASGVSHPVLCRTLDQARTLVRLAAQKNRLLGLNAQYVAAQSVYKRMYEAAHGPLNDISSVYFLLESKGISGRHNTHEGIWIDMSPHALSQTIAWLPDAELDVESVDCRIMADQTVTRFRYGTAEVEAVLRKSGDSAMRRRFGVNGFIVDYEGRADENGVYRTYLSHGDQTTVTDDLVQRSIRHFIGAATRGEGRPLVDGQAALKNLEISMMILERARRS